LGYLICQIEQCESVYNNNADVTLSSVMQFIYDNNLLDDPELLRKEVKSGFYALESIPFSIVPSTSSLLPKTPSNSLNF
jgi:hypothetical protein